MGEAEFRAARPADAAALVQLIDLAGAGLPLHRWSELAGPGEEPVAYGARMVASETGRFSYTNACVAELDGEIVGMMLGRMEPLTDLDPPPDIRESAIRPWRDLETLAAGSWLLRAIAVKPPCRKKGIARSLLGMADNLARKHGAEKLAIIAAEEGVAAMALYRGHGFETLARRKVVAWPNAPHNGDWLLLVKRL